MLDSKALVILRPRVKTVENGSVKKLILEMMLVNCTGGPIFVRVNPRISANVDIADGQGVNFSGSYGDLPEERDEKYSFLSRTKDKRLDGSPVLEHWITESIFLPKRLPELVAEDEAEQGALVKAVVTLGFNYFSPSENAWHNETKKVEVTLRVKQ